MSHKLPYPLKELIDMTFSYSFDLNEKNPYFYYINSNYKRYKEFMTLKDYQKLPFVTCFKKNINGQDYSVYFHSKNEKDEMLWILQNDTNNTYYNLKSKKFLKRINDDTFAKEPFTLLEILKELELK